VGGRPPEGGGAWAGVRVALNPRRRRRRRRRKRRRKRRRRRRGERYGIHLPALPE